MMRMFLSEISQATTIVLYLITHTHAQQLLLQEKLNG